MSKKKIDENKPVKVRFRSLRGGTRAFVRIYGSIQGHPVVDKDDLVRLADRLGTVEEWREEAEEQEQQKAADRRLAALRQTFPDVIRDSDLTCETVEGGLRVHGRHRRQMYLREILDRVPVDDSEAAALSARARAEDSDALDALAALADRLEELRHDEAENVRNAHIVRSGSWPDRAIDVVVAYDRTFRADEVPSLSELDLLWRETETLFALAKFYKLKGVSRRWTCAGICNAFRDQLNA